MSDHWIPPEKWETIVRNMPIPSIDLVVETPDGIVLAKRSNEPAKGEWFVPGGRIRKGEPLEDAVHRVATEELGIVVTIEKSLGTFTHFWEVSDVNGVSKHNITHAYLVSTDATTVELDDQHEEVRTVAERPDVLHEYVVAFLDAANVLT